ncbi:MAG: AMP-binding protein [Acidobacteriota bacterium]
MRESLASFLDDWERRSDEPAIAQRAGVRVVQWSYAGLSRLAFQFSRELEARRVDKGDRVLFCGGNSAEWVAAFFACLLRGAIVVPLDLESTPGFVARVQEQVGAKLLLAGREQRSLAPNLPVVTLENLAQIAGSHSASHYSPDRASPTDIAEIIFTSGTTAEPKGVCITHANVLANLEPLEREIHKYLKWERPFHPLRFLNLLPLSHVFGQFMGMFVPQLLGGEALFQDSMNPSEIIQAARKHRASVIAAVPRVLDSIRHKIEIDYEASGQTESFNARLAAADGQHFLRRWWVFRRIHRKFGWKFWAFVSGGAALSADTEVFWRRLGFVVVQGYGMTETAALVSLNHPFKVGRGSIGKTLPGQEVRLSESGEILVRGTNVSPGYWRGGLVPLTNEEGWLKTGDVGERDAQGNLYFKSRSKDVIVTAAGMNIYPEDLEAALNSQPEVRESAVIGVESHHGPEPIAVLIMSRADADATIAVKRANKGLNQYQQIRRWEVWPEADFPRTPTRKVRKRELVEWMKERPAVTADQPAGNAEIKSTQAASSFILEQIARVSGESAAHADPSANLATDLKLDSMGRVELLSALEDHYQIDIDEAAFSEATTLAEVEKLVREGGTESNERAYPRWSGRWPVTWIRTLAAYLLLLPLTRLMSRVRVAGRERIRGERGPLLFVSNHVAMVDQSLILAALPGRFHRKLAIAMEGEKLWGWRHPRKDSGLIARLAGLIEYVLVVALFNVFPLPQKSGFRKSFAFAGELMDRGYSVLVFPEGRRARDERMQRFMEGIGLLARQLGVKVVPVRIDGLYELKKQRRYFARPGEVKVTFGEPLSFDDSDDPETITRTLEEKVSSL